MKALQTEQQPERPDEPREHPEAADYWAFMAVRKVRGLARIGAVTAILVGPLVAPVQGAPSRCKGLSEQTCRTEAACAWMAERKAGETKAKSGELHKVSAKAHCRLNTRKTG
jgi:hypothetical protein